MSRARIEPSGPFLRHPLQPHELRDRVTRTQDTIVLWHLGLPQLDADAWSVAIDGLVRRFMRLTLPEFRRRPRLKITSIHQCCGRPLRPDLPARRVCHPRERATPSIALPSRSCDAVADPSRPNLAAPAERHRMAP